MCVNPSGTRRLWWIILSRSLQSRFGCSFRLFDSRTEERCLSSDREQKIVRQGDCFLLSLRDQYLCLQKLSGSPRKISKTL